jgi:hypothetical protein
MKEKAIGYKKLFFQENRPKKRSSLHTVPKEVLPVILFLFPHKLLVFVVVLWVG